ncbi:dUTP diphosphatase [Candidatus Poriferisodalis sp.]|uniref:dUTP diphosphatase n=1 Tax=Candidatus Poriferisodalis sp. TaxID=3101277 RepID=UPI003D128649
MGAPTVVAVVSIPIRRIDPDLPLPSYAKPGDAGCDLVAAETVTLAPGGGRAMIRSGIAIAIPPGYAGFVQPRSGLALRHGITCVNSPGLIDSGYRDELRVLLLNTDPTEPYEVQRGDRIAQLVIQRVEAAEWTLVESLDDSERGLGGFGHSGR